MKNTILLLFMTYLFWSCTSDNFYETERYFETNKELYNIGDEFEVTVFIVPEKYEKEIRLYDNYKNINVWFSVINTNRGIHYVSITKSTQDYQRDTTSTKHKITRKRPFKKIFLGKISETESEIIIEIPELNFEDGLPKSDFDENTKVRIHGLCNPINPEIGASIEEFIKAKDIKILTE